MFTLKSFLESQSVEAAHVNATSPVFVNKYERRLWGRLTSSSGASILGQRSLSSQEYF